MVDSRVIVLKKLQQKKLNFIDLDMFLAIIPYNFVMIYNNVNFGVNNFCARKVRCYMSLKIHS